MNRFIPKATSCVAALFLFTAILAINNPASAQAPKMPPPPPDDPLVRLEKAVGKLDTRLGNLETRVTKLEKRADDADTAKATADENAKKLTKRVGSVEKTAKKLDTRVTTLESRPPLKVTEYVKLYKVAPPTYIFVPVSGERYARKCYTYVESDLHLFNETTTIWVKVTK